MTKWIVVLLSVVVGLSDGPIGLGDETYDSALRPLRHVERQPAPLVLQTRRAWFQKLVASIRSVPPVYRKAPSGSATTSWAGLVMTRRRATQLLSTGAVALGLDPQGLLSGLPATETVAIPAQTFAQLSATYFSSAGEALFGVLPLSMSSLDTMVEAVSQQKQPEASLPLLEEKIFQVMEISQGSAEWPRFVLPSPQEMEVLRQFFSSEENMRLLKDNPIVRHWQAGRPDEVYFVKKSPEEDRQLREWDAVHPVDERTLRQAFYGLRRLFTSFDQETYQQTIPRIVGGITKLAESDPRFEEITRVMGRFQEAGAQAAAEDPWYRAQVQKREAWRQTPDKPGHESESPHVRQTDQAVLPVLRDQFEANRSLLSVIESHSTGGPLELHLVWHEGQLRDGELVRRTPASARWGLSAWQYLELEALWPIGEPGPGSTVMIIPFEPQSDWLAVLTRLRLVFEMSWSHAQLPGKVQPEGANSQQVEGLLKFLIPRLQNFPSKDIAFMIQEAFSQYPDATIGALARLVDRLDRETFPQYVHEFHGAESLSQMYTGVVDKVRAYAREHRKLWDEIAIRQHAQRYIEEKMVPQLRVSVSQVLFEALQVLSIDIRRRLVQEAKILEFEQRWHREASVIFDQDLQQFLGSVKHEVRRHALLATSL